MSRNKLALAAVLLLLTLTLGASVTTGGARPGRGLRAVEPPVAYEPEPGGLAALYLGQQRRCTEMTEHLLTDFSGNTLRGTLTYPNGGLTGADVTLTITKESGSSGDIQNFTLTRDDSRGGPRVISGRLTAETTCGYTGVTIIFPEPPTTIDNRNPPPQPTIISLNACKTGGGFTLTGVTTRFCFTSREPASATPEKKWGRFCKFRCSPAS